MSFQAGSICVGARHRRRAPRSIAAAAALLLAASPAAAQLLLQSAPAVPQTRDCATCPSLVGLPSGLMMSRTPVTRGEFRRFVETTGFRQTGSACRWDGTEFAQTDEHPVVCVSFDDAARYAAWLAKTTGHPYRLPTLDELRYALSANEDAYYWWGHAIGENRANCDGCRSPFDGTGTAPVGSFEANRFNVADAVGNVWIWSTDCPHPGCGERYLIGGGWSSPPGDLRLTKTIWTAAGAAFDSYGLRVVREAAGDGRTATAYPSPS